MSLNPAKLELMTVTNKIVVHHPQLFIGADTIEEENSLNYLVIDVDTRLKSMFRLIF